MSDIEQRLREAMDGVTPGPWVCIENDEDSFDYDKLHISTDDRVYRSKGPIAEIGVGFDDPFETEQRRSAEFIALCSPDNIGALLDTIASLRSKLEEAEGALERMADTSEYYDGLGLLTYKPRMSADDMQSLAFRTLASLREADHA